MQTYLDLQDFLESQRARHQTVTEEVKREQTFICHNCHNLTYKSTQEWDKRVAHLKKNPELLAALIKDPNTPINQRVLCLRAVLEGLGYR